MRWREKQTTAPRRKGTTMNKLNAEQWATYFYNYARNTLSLDAAPARVYAVNWTRARAAYRCMYLHLEQYAAANLTA